MSHNLHPLQQKILNEIISVLGTNYKFFDVVADDIKDCDIDEEISEIFCGFTFSASDEILKHCEDDDLIVAKQKHYISFFAENDEISMEIDEEREPVNSESLFTMLYWNTTLSQKPPEINGNLNNALLPLGKLPEAKLLKFIKHQWKCTMCYSTHKAQFLIKPPEKIKWDHCNTLHKVTL